MSPVDEALREKPNFAGIPHGLPRHSLFQKEIPTYHGRSLISSSEYGKVVSHRFCTK